MKWVNGSCSFQANQSPMATFVTFDSHSNTGKGSINNTIIRFIGLTGTLSSKIHSQLFIEEMILEMVFSTSLLEGSRKTSNAYSSLTPIPHFLVSPTCDHSRQQRWRVDSVEPFRNEFQNWIE